MHFTAYPVRQEDSLTFYGGKICSVLICIRSFVNINLFNFAMGTILGKGFTCSSTSAKGTSAMNCMHECLSKTLFQNYCPHGKITFSNSTLHLYVIRHHPFLLHIAKKQREKESSNCMATLLMPLLGNVHSPMIEFVRY